MNLNASKNLVIGFFKEAHQSSIFHDILECEKHPAEKCDIET